MVGKERSNPGLWDTMLTQGALRQRRRRALESADERKERLARDAERKRIKRLSESAEEAAWRRTVDAMRKKEKRMKEKIEKLEGQYTTMDSAKKVKVDMDGSDPVMGIARTYSRRRRIKRTDMSDYVLFPDNSDITDFGDSGGGFDLPNSLLEARLKGVHSPVPGTSAGLSKGSTCCGEHLNVVGVSVGCSYSNNSACTRPAISGVALPGVSRGRQRRSRAIRSQSYRSKTDTLCVPLIPPGVTIEKVKVPPCRDRVDIKSITDQPDENLCALSPEVIISEVKLEPMDDEDMCTFGVGANHSLSSLCPEVSIREVKSEPLDEDEEGDHIVHNQHISALSPEVIISEVKPLVLDDDESGDGVPRGSWCSSTEHEDNGVMSGDVFGRFSHDSCSDRGHVTLCSSPLKHVAGPKVHPVAMSVAQRRPGHLLS